MKFSIDKNILKRDQSGDLRMVIVDGNETQGAYLFCVEFPIEVI